MYVRRHIYYTHTHTRCQVVTVDRERDTHIGAMIAAVNDLAFTKEG